jgi:hypothetical protein
LRIYKRKTTDQFIQESNVVHNNKYEYPHPYVGSRDKIGIICPTHGIFFQRPYSHLSGIGCKCCDVETRAKFNTLTHTQFADQSHKIHNHQYTYAMPYVSSQSKIAILCDKHGTFNQYPYLHLLGHGCPHCRNKFTKRTPSKFSGGPGCYSHSYFNKFPTEKNIIGCIYVLKLTIAGQYFLKIGITKNDESRVNNYRNFKAEELYKHPATLYNAFLLEQQLLTLHKEDNIIPTVFPGHTECFVYSEQLLNQLITQLTENNI